MTQRRRWWRRLTTRPDEGAAAVEFALLFPIFAILVMGMISAGMAWSRQINITQAARETSRFGATLSFKAAAEGGTGTVDDWLDKVDEAATSAGGPADMPIGGYDSRCVAFVDQAGNTKHMQDGGTKASGTCPGTAINSALGPAYVQVVFTRNVSFFAVFMNPTLTLDSLSATPYELTP
jgi:Flp pilus assembly protein TadG